MKEKIGIGITTCNRPDYFKDCIKSIDLDKIDYVVITNDGKPFDYQPDNEKIIFIQNETNLGISKSKNKIFEKLLELECTHIFTLEDDCIITNNDVWELYIKASKETGIGHFNYGPGSPWNRYQKDSTIIGDLSKRKEASQEGKPIPKLVINYKNNVSISLFEHIVAMFCYFNVRVLRKAGLYNEEFYNAWEHVEHTLRIIKNGDYTPFWWFADVTGSENYIKEAKDEKANSSLAPNEEKFMQNVVDGLKIFYKLHQTVPSQIPPARPMDIEPILKQIYARNKNN